MKRDLLTTLVVAGALVAVADVSPAAAQRGLLGRIRERAAETIEERVQTEVDQALGAGTADADTQAEVAPTGVGSTSVTEAAPAEAAATKRPGEGAWANYDFVPGDRPLFLHDFSEDRVGDFPRRLEFSQGNMEVVEWQGRRWLRATSEGHFALPLPEVLPERFTLEFDYAGLNKYELKVRFHGPDWRDEEEIQIGAWGWGVNGSTVKAMSRPRDAEGIENRIVRVRVMADGSYVKVYVDGERVANVPNANLGRADRIWFEVPAWNETPALVGDIQVMAGGDDLYDSLVEDGRVATQGILFDTGSDRIRPESTPTLQEIASALQAHPELKLAIEGHTDNVGQAAANQTLSERRAAAVKQTLIELYEIDASRLESRGFGADNPVATNDTAEGRQENRRVELVRL